MLCVQERASCVLRRVRVAVMLTADIQPQMTSSSQFHHLRNSHLTPIPQLPWRLQLRKTHHSRRTRRPRKNPTRSRGTTNRSASSNSELSHPPPPPPPSSQNRETDWRLTRARTQQVEERVLRPVPEGGAAELPVPVPQRRGQGHVWRVLPVRAVSFFVSRQASGLREDG